MFLYQVVNDYYEEEKLHVCNVKCKVPTEDVFLWVVMLTAEYGKQLVRTLDFTDNAIQLKVPIKTDTLTITI